MLEGDDAGRRVTGAGGGGGGGREGAMANIERRKEKEIVRGRSKERKGAKERMSAR